MIPRVVVKTLMDLNEMDSLHDEDEVMVSWKEHSSLSCRSTSMLCTCMKAIHFHVLPYPCSQAWNEADTASTVAFE